MNYLDARPFMATGDFILWKGEKLGQRIIRLFSDDYSHASPIVRSNDEAERNRVRIIDTTGKNANYRFLSEELELDHGSIYWIPMFTPPEAAAIIKEEATKLIGKPYDYKSTLSIRAILGKMLLRDDKINCSETCWILHRKAGTVQPVYDKRGRELFPSPGQLPKWVNVQPIHVEGVFQ